MHASVRFWLKSPFVSRPSLLVVPTMASEAVAQMASMLVDCYPACDEAVLAEGVADSCEAFLLHHADIVVRLLRMSKRPK